MTEKRGLAPCLSFNRSNSTLDNIFMLVNSQAMTVRVTQTAQPTMAGLVNVDYQSRTSTRDSEVSTGGDSVLIMQ